ncbi:MAG TPA: hypothetical protein VIV12_01540 [Streptosporangiaceae bacterium]
MRRLRSVGTLAVTVAVGLLAYDQDTIPRPVRVGALVVIAAAGALGIPAAAPVTRSAAEADRQAS